MENRYNTLIISREYYRTDDEFNLAIGEAISMLQKNDYLMEIPRREGNMVIIHYNYPAPEFGTPIPIWLTSEEEEKALYVGD